MAGVDDSRLSFGRALYGFDQVDGTFGIVSVFDDLEEERRWGKLVGVNVLGVVIREERLYHGE